MAGNDLPLKLQITRLYNSMREWILADVQQMLGNNIIGGKVISSGISGVISTANLPTTYSSELTATDFKATGLTGATSGTRYVGATASGAPVAGTFLKGDYIIDQTGKVYICTTAGSPGSWTAVGGSGSGNVTSSTNYGSEPGAPASGDLDLYANAFLQGRYDGSNWIPWGPIWPLNVPPSIGTRSTTVLGWNNQGSATAATTNGGIAMIDPGTTRNLRQLTITCPSTPYSITTLMVPIWNMLSNPFGWGMCWSDGTSLHTFQFFASASPSQISIYVGDWTNATTFGSWAQAGAAWGSSFDTLMWMRLRDDGTNRHFSLSFDGFNFVDFYSCVRTSFITPTQVGVFIDNETGVANMGATLMSWKQA